MKNRHCVHETRAFQQPTSKFLGLLGGRASHVDECEGEATGEAESGEELASHEGFMAV